VTAKASEPLRREAEERMKEAVAEGNRSRHGLQSPAVANSPQGDDADKRGTRATVAELADTTPYKARQALKLYDTDPEALDEVAACKAWTDDLSRVR
jgi:hypothetical protein